jgi:hypothetical protein
MNKRINKIVEGLKNKKKGCIRRDQVRKAIEENAFSYFIYKGYDEVYNVEPEKMAANIENIRDYWLTSGDMWGQLHDNDTKLEITIKYGYSYMELWVNLEEEVKPVAAVEPKEEEKEINSDIKVVFNTEKSGIELYFKEKPLAELRNKLKAHGFKYHGKKICWYAKDSEENRSFLEAENILVIDSTDDIEEVEEINISVDELNDISDIENVEIIEEEPKEIKSESVINESLAKRAKENISFSDYKENSATKEYDSMVADAAEQIEAAKPRVSDEGKIKLDNLLNWYKSKLANWINKHNSNGASHVSWMISGPSNYNMKKHEKWLNKEGKLWEEYNDITNISAKISTIINSDKVIRTDDKNALEKLRDKLNKALEEHQSYKDYNVKARKEGKETLRPYVLQNSNQRIRNIKQRITNLERLEKQKEINPKEEVEINGIKIIDNLDANRLQIVFGFKPSEEIRKELKRYGFRWSPSNGAWQKYRGLEAERIAKDIANKVIEK